MENTRCKVSKLESVNVFFFVLIIGKYKNKGLITVNEKQV